MFVRSYWVGLSLGLLAGVALASGLTLTEARGPTALEVVLPSADFPEPVELQLSGPVTGGIYAIVDPDWAKNALWDDGRAELDLYAGSLHREFALRDDAYAVHVVVKEAFTPEYLVKANDWRVPGRFDVLKLNYITHARTGLYDWDEMISTFVDRSRLVPVKMTYGRQEWCGNVFKEWRRFSGQKYLFVSSYFEPIGTQRMEHDLADEVVPYNALPLVLRALRFDRLSAGDTLSFPMLPTMLGSGASPSGPIEATLSVGENATVTVPAGRFATIALQLSYPGRTRRGQEPYIESETYWIELAAPNRIVQSAGPGEERLQLMRSERLAYWQMSGDEVGWFPAGAVPTSAEGS